MCLLLFFKQLVHSLHPLIVLVISRSQHECRYVQVYAQRICLSVILFIYLFISQTQASEFNASHQRHRSNYCANIFQVLRYIFSPQYRWQLTWGVQEFALERKATLGGPLIGLRVSCESMCLPISPQPTIQSGPHRCLTVSIEN